MADPIGSATTCNLWFDPSDLTTVHATAGAVDTLDDKSGAGRNATAATTARPTTGTRLLNGRNVLDFDGVANIMKTGSFTLAAPYTWAIVTQGDNGPNSTQETIFGDVTNGIAILKSTSNTYAVFSGNTVGAGTVDTAPHIWVVVGGSATVASVQIDGNTLVSGGNSGTTAGAGGAVLGSNNAVTHQFNGAIGEVVSYNAILSASDQARLYQYLYKKWAARSIVPMQSTLLVPKIPTLLPTERLIRPATPTVTTITGTSSTTNANDTSAAAGTTTVTGTLATTNANDTMTASGIILPRATMAPAVVLRPGPSRTPLPIIPPKRVQQTAIIFGTSSTTNANDTLNASGSVGAAVTGSSSTTNANDTSVAAGTTTVKGTSATTNANDTLTANGVVGTPVVVTPPTQQVGGTLSGRRGPYTAVDAELAAILADDDEVLCLI